MRSVIRKTTGKCAEKYKEKKGRKKSSPFCRTKEKPHRLGKKGTSVYIKKGGGNV